MFGTLANVKLTFFAIDFARVFLGKGTQVIRMNMLGHSQTNDPAIS